MASRAGAHSLARAGASDSEDDLAIGTNNDARNATKTKKTMQKSTTGKTATKRKAAPKQSRTALKDRTNIQGSDSEGADEADIAKPKAKRAKTTTTRKPKAAKEPHIEPLPVIPETQPDVAPDEGVELSIEVGNDDTEITRMPTPKQAPRVVQRPRATSVQPTLQPQLSARSASVQPTYAARRERSGSVSGTERERRGGDPELRRKLNDMTAKYENINLKYQNLQEIGKSNAETNFEKLKRATDQKTKDANELIASLKKEIVEMRKSHSANNSETSALQKSLAAVTASNESLKSENTAAKERLLTSQNEVKALEAKLVAARQQVSSYESKATTSATIPLSRSVAGNVAETQKESKMKENLYADLTGLIIRSVKRKDEEDEYDCIQTGRNGTLHFHVFVAHENANGQPKTPSGDSYQDVEFAYQPLLDESRDRELLELLPDYLSEAIEFPRRQAMRFYSKMLESMTKRVVYDEE